MTRAIHVLVPGLVATAAPCLADQIIQEGQLSGGKGKQTHQIELDQFDTMGGTRELQFVRLDVLTSVIGGGQGDGSGVAVHCFAQLSADYALEAVTLAATVATIDFVYPNTQAQSFTLFDNDTDQAVIDQAADLAAWIGPGQIVLTAETSFAVFEDPRGIVNFSAGGGASYTVIYDFVEVRPCPADLNGDGAVGTADLLDLLAQWGTDPGGPPDLDGDGVVGTSDLLILLGGWGSCPS